MRNGAAPFVIEVSTDIRFSALYLSQTIESRLIPNVMKIVINPLLLALATAVVNVQNLEVAEKGETRKVSDSSPLLAPHNIMSIKNENDRFTKAPQVMNINSTHGFRKSHD